MAPADVGLGGLLGSRLFLALFHFDFEQLCPEHVPGHGAIAVLGTIALALYNNVCRNMRQAHSRLSFVHVLAAGTTRSHDIGPHIAVLDVDFDAIIDHRIDSYTGE